MTNTTANQEFASWMLYSKGGHMTGISKNHVLAPYCAYRPTETLCGRRVPNDAWWNKRADDDCKRCTALFTNQ